MSTFKKFSNGIQSTIQNQKKSQTLKNQTKNVLFNNFMNTESPNNSSENTTSDDDDYDYNIIQAKRQMRIDPNMQKELKKYSESTRRSRSKSPSKRATRHGRRVRISDVVEYKTMSPPRRKSPSPTKSYPKCDRRTMRFINGLMTRPCRIQNSVFHTKEEWDEYMEMQLEKIATTQKFLKENRDPNYKRPHTTKSRRRR